jgi:hypothetical protein
MSKVTPIENKNPSSGSSFQESDLRKRAGEEE